MCEHCPQRSEEGIGFSRTEVTDGCQPQGECLKVNPVPLQEQVLITCWTISPSLNSFLNGWFISSCYTFLLVLREKSGISIFCEFMHIAKYVCESTVLKFVTLPSLVEMMEISFSYLRTDKVWVKFDYEWVSSLSDSLWRKLSEKSWFFS